MARPSFSITEYRALASEKGLILLSDNPPYSIRLKTHWKCANCGKEHHKSFHQLKYSRNASCRCYNGMSLPVSAYYELGNKLGVQYASMFPPSNIMEEVSWVTLDDRIFRASYHQLGYGKIPEKLREYVRI